MSRVFHHYLTWEDFQQGMWDVASSAAEKPLLERAIAFTGNAELYGAYMDRVVVEWPIACEHNLTNDALNQQAWVGHAAVALAFRCPEYITRRAWAFLTTKQRDDANARAQAAIDAWAVHYTDRKGQYALRFQA